MLSETTLIFPDWDAPDNVRGLFTTRQGGVSTPPYHGQSTGEGGLNLALHVGDAAENVRSNRHLLSAWLPAEPLWINQVHGITVVPAGAAPDLPDADAAFSTARHQVCVVQTADCLPVLFCDREGRTVAAAHAGWRGLAQGVLETALREMRHAGAGEILAWLGPAIGPENFEVGQDVREAFADRERTLTRYFKPRPGLPGKCLADLYALARHILEKQGVSHISGGGFCTVSDAARFYSYRRDGVTGRMAACIWLD
jgi:YfiH family protein